MTEQEFPGGTVDQGSSIVTTVALVAAMMQVGSMAQELPNAVGVAKRQTNNHWEFSFGVAG